MMAEANDIDARLQAAADADARLRTIDRELRAIDAELHKAHGSEERWRRQAARATDELHRLRGSSLSALWQRLRGHAAARIGEQEARITEARREQEAIDQRSEPLHRRRAELARGREPLAAAPAEFAAALAAKDALLRANGGDFAERAAAGLAAVQRLQQEQRAIDRVLMAAREAEASLVLAREHLGQARQLGQVDLLGGGAGVTSAKQAGLDVARGYLERARRALAHVADALGAEAASLAALDLGDGLRLADLLADSLIVDLLVHARIRSAHDRVRDFVPRLRDVIQGLERRAVTAHVAAAAAADERAAWLCSVRLR